MSSTVQTADHAVNRADPAGDTTRLTGRQRLALFALLTASFTLAVDFSILNVALPTIGADIGFSLDHLQWIATSFALCAAGFTLFFGRIADLFGRRRFRTGTGVEDRRPGGPGARDENGRASGTITVDDVVSREGPQRNKALGLNGTLMAAGFTTGAILGGVLTDLLSWRWAFFINVFVAVVVLAIAPFVLKESRPNERPRLDFAGAATVTLGLLALVYGLTTAGETSWVNPLAWGSILTGFVLLVGFWEIEKRVAHPLVPVAILKRKTVTSGNIAGLLAFATETSLVFLLTLYLQEVLGYSPLAAGLSFAILGAGTVLGGIIGPKVIGTLGSRPAIVAGFLLQAAATIPLIFLGFDSDWLLLLLVATFIGGVANLVAIVGYVVTSTSGLPDAEQGLATGLVTMSQQVGITMGIPIMSAIVTARMNALGDTGPAGVLGGVTTAIGVNALLCVLAAAAIALFLRPTKSDKVNA